MTSAVRSPVVRPRAALLPDATICLAPIHAMRIIETYTQTIMSGLLKLITRSALLKSL